MEVHTYFDLVREIQDNILSFIDADDKADYSPSIFKDFMDSKKFGHDIHELKVIIELIKKISKNHKRRIDFYEKIESILLYFSSEIAKNFSNYEIFDFFKKDKLILLILLKNKIISIDNRIISYINDQRTRQVDKNYEYFFYPEIKPFISTEKAQRIERDLLSTNPDIFTDKVFNFSIYDSKRKSGENDSFICNLIRNDMIEDFVQCINQNNISISKTFIKRSVFETNSFLIKSDYDYVSLMEYAMFFGSIQIVQYMKFNRIVFTPSLWFYVIHSNNPELIHFLEENHIEPKDKSYLECLKESIKCHHNDIAEYIQNCLLEQTKNVDDFIHENALHYFNYFYFPKELCLYILNYLCTFELFDIVKSFLNENKSLYLLEPIKISADLNNGELINLLMSFIGIRIESKYLKFCKKLTKLSIPSNIVSIEQNAFIDCKSLIEIIIPSSVTYIGDYAFYGCSSLASIKIPSSVVEIGHYAFYNCSSLKEIEIPSSVKKIGSYSFYGCKSLEKASINSPIVCIERELFENCISLKEFEIPNSVTEIKEFAFLDCVSLSKIVIPKSVKKMYKSSFKNCKSLKEIELPDSVTLIDDNFFQ